MESAPTEMRFCVGADSISAHALPQFSSAYISQEWSAGEEYPGAAAEEADEDVEAADNNKEITKMQRRHCHTKAACDGADGHHQG